MARFLFRHLKGYRFLVVVAIALTFAQVGASLLVAFPLKFVLDKLVAIGPAAQREGEHIT
jgi:hypothetical protein